MGSKARACALSALLVVVAACGDGGNGATGTPEPGGADGGITAETWLADVCGATKAWVDEILSLQTDLQGNLETSSLRELKRTFVAYFDDILVATDDMLAEIDAAGVPDAEGGQQAADAIAAGLNDAREVLQRARDDAADLPTDDPQVFSRRLQAIGQEVQTSLTDVGDAMGQLDAPELDRVAENVEECQELEQL